MKKLEAGVVQQHINHTLNRNLCKLNLQLRLLRLQRTLLAFVAPLLLSSCGGNFTPTAPASLTHATTKPGRG
eukprot:2429518-Amphidinium_carterae.5